MNDTDKIWVASFDIGKKNFAFYIQEIDLTEIKKIPNIQPNNRYKQNGTTTDEMEYTLQQIYKTGTTVTYSNSDITTNCDQKAYLDPETFHNMNDVLDSNIQYFDRCSYIIIEQQMSFRKAYNTMCLKLAQHCYSYFTFKYGRFKNISYFPAYHKTQILGAAKTPSKKYKNGKYKYKNMTQYQRKKWAVQKAEEILLIRGEIDVWKNIKSKKKKLDDISDCILMTVSFSTTNFLNNILDKHNQK